MRIMLTFSFYEFENDERFIETSFPIFITDFYSQLNYITPDNFRANKKDRLRFP